MTPPAPAVEPAALDTTTIDTQPTSPHTPARLSAPPPLARPPFWVRLPLALMLVALPALILLYTDKYIVDDAFIGYRHAHNIATGRGPIFNVGERVEGFTNFLWTFIAVIPIKLGWRPDAFTAILGASLAALAMLRAGRTAARLGAGPANAMLAMLPLALYPGYWRAATSGIEGGLYSFLLVETASAIVLARPMWLAGLLGGLLFATRPESAGLLPAFWLIALWVRSTRVPWESGSGLSHDSAPSLRAAARSTVPMLIVWLALIAALTAWRLLYYGHPLPNSVTAKSASFSDWPSLRHSIINGWKYTLDYIGRAAPLIAAAAFGLLLRPRTPAVILAALLLTGATGVCLMNGGDWMANNRLLSVYSALLVIPAALGFRRIAELATTRRWGILLVGLAIAVIAGAIFRTGSGERWLKRPSLALYPDNPVYGEIADLLRPALTPDDILSTEGLGLFGYRLIDTRIHDFLGLTDEHIAHHGKHRDVYGRRDYAYTINTVRPAAILVHSGLYHINGFIAESQGDFNESYEVYRLGPQSPNPNNQMMIVVRRDAVPRFIPALKRWSPTRITISPPPPPDPQPATR